MNIEFIQAFIAKLYTNGDFLTLFKQVPEASFDLMKLPEQERAFFQSIDIQKINKVYAIIKKKQLQMIQNAYPIFSTYYQSEFAEFSEAFLRLAKNYSWSPEGKVRLSTDFHDFCTQKLSPYTAITPPFLKDLLRFEHLYFTIKYREVPQIYRWADLYSKESINPQTRIMVHEYIHIEDFEFPILEIINQLENSNLISLQFKSKNTHLLFIPSKPSIPKLVSLSPEHRKLLPYFNGEYEFEVLGATIKKHESPDVFDQIPSALAFLKSHQILVLL